MTLDLRDRLALAVACAAVVLLGAAAYLAISPADAGGTTDPGVAVASDSSMASAPIPSAALGLVIDVEGGVARPGIVSLPGDARVADAIRAAGGYADDADLAAAARSLNLAARLTDGAQVYVPVLGAPGGEDGGAGGGTGSGGGGSVGLVNLNTASAAALESLPGIGPVTAAKIIAAREETPFATLDELVDRKVMNRGQLEGIRDLVTI